MALPANPVVLDDRRYSVFLKQHFSFSSALEGFLDRLTTRIHQTQCIRNRVDTFQVTKKAASVLLGNLYRAYLRDPQLYVAVSLNANGYERGIYNPLDVSYRGIKRVLDFLTAQVPALADFHPGGNFGDTRRNFYSRLRATANLVALIELELGAITGASASTHRLTNDTSEGRSSSYSVGQLFSVGELPAVRLKNSRKKYIRFPSTSQTRRMEGELKEWNEFQHLHWLDILVENDAFRQATMGRADPDREDEEDELQEGSRDRRVDMTFDRKVYRTFNNGSFDQGGRIYGGWWMNIASRWRRSITINWAPTQELDYSNMQAAMLYAQEGLQLEGDAYQIEGIPTSYRKLLKRTFFKLVNAQGRMRAPLRSELPAGWSWSQILAAMRERHSPIARHFNTGIGIRLQRIDANLAMTVMRRFQQRDILVLPIHDSFISYIGVASELRAEMAACYRDAMNREIGIDVDEGFAGQYIEEMREGEYLEDIVHDLEQQPEYSGYSARKQDYLSRQTDEWRWRFSI